MRGNPRAAFAIPGTGGSIPACAGEPWKWKVTSHAPSVYPRVCGGTRASRAVGAACHGLSPRVRGNLVLEDGMIRGTGSIPACAGEPRFITLRKARRTVYPRVCGGTVGESRQPTGGGGLSPRVRGNLPLYNVVDEAGGSIPACAGEPRTTARARRPTAVYPRVCGGTASMSPSFGGKSGLSPRVRGNPRVDGANANAGGSIPACAGEPIGGAGNH